MIESLAAGTPVIALRRGSVPEVIEDGVTGLICDDVDEMADAVGRIAQIDPEACRRGAERFTAERMCRARTCTAPMLNTRGRPGPVRGVACSRASGRTEAEKKNGKMDPRIACATPHT